MLPSPPYLSDYQLLCKAYRDAGRRVEIVDSINYIGNIGVASLRSDPSDPSRPHPRRRGPPLQPPLYQGAWPPWGAPPRQPLRAHRDPGPLGTGPPGGTDRVGARRRPGDRPGAVEPTSGQAHPRRTREADPER